MKWSYAYFGIGVLFGVAGLLVFPFKETTIGQVTCVVISIAGCVMIVESVTIARTEEILAKLKTMEKAS